MKKIIALSLCAALLATACGTAKKTVKPAIAPNNTVSSAEKAAKRLEAEGWKLYGPKAVFSLEEVMGAYQAKVVDTERYDVATGSTEGLGFKDMTAATFSVQAVAAARYAASISQVVSSKLDAQFSNLSPDTRTKIVGGFEQRLEEEVVKGFKEDFLLTRIVGTEFQAQGFYYIDKTEANKLTVQAMDNALIETAGEQIIGQEISKWIHQTYQQ